MQNTVVDRARTVAEAASRCRSPALALARRNAFPKRDGRSVGKLGVGQGVSKRALFLLIEEADVKLVGDGSAGLSGCS
jgi:hypothetical protein